MLNALVCMLCARSSNKCFADSSFQNDKPVNQNLKCVSYSVNVTCITNSTDTQNMTVFLKEKLGYQPCIHFVTRECSSVGVMCSYKISAVHYFRL